MWNISVLKVGAVNSGLKVRLRIYYLYKVSCIPRSLCGGRNELKR